MWVIAVGVAIFQIVGSIGAEHNQPERHSLDVLAIALLLIGPAALAWRDRWPLVAFAISACAADLYVWFGYPYGPIFVSVAVSLFAAVQTGRDSVVSCRERYAATSTASSAERRSRPYSTGRSRREPRTV